MTSPVAIVSRRAAPGRVSTTSDTGLPPCVARKNWLSASPGTLPGTRKADVTPVMTGTSPRRAAVNTERTVASTAGVHGTIACAATNATSPSVAPGRTNSMTSFPVSFGGRPFASTATSVSKVRRGGTVSGAATAAVVVAVTSTRAMPAVTSGASRGRNRSALITVARTTMGAASASAVRSAKLRAVTARGGTTSAFAPTMPAPHSASIASHAVVRFATLITLSITDTAVPLSRTRLNPG